MTPRVVLVGLPGTGKSTSGRRLAKILGVAFADSDDLVEAQAGRTVREIFRDDGEPAFRAAEFEAISAALRDFDGVLALGGGALTSDATQRAIEASGPPVAVLTAPSGTLHTRVGTAESRPLLAGDPLARLRELDDERSPVYQRLSTFTVDTDGRTPGQVAATVAARLHERRVRT